MNPQTDAERFTELLKTVAEFYDVTVSPARSTMFFGALRDYDFEIVELAFSKFMQSGDSKYGFPKPASIREIVEGSQSEQEANAWNAVTEAIRRVGFYQSIIIQDPAVADAIVRVFGSWAACCERANQANPYLWEAARKEFVTAYRIARKIERKDRTPVLLGGYTEIQNRIANRFPKAQPYGVILLDGRVRSRYLDIDERTGLPAITLADVPMLSETPRLALPPASRETDGGALVEGEALIALGDAFERLMKSRSFPPKLSVKIPTHDPDAKGRAKIRRQAAQIHAETAAESLRTRKTATTGHPDRSANHGGETATGGTGIPVRGDARKKLARGSRVAGVSDPVRDRGGRVRKRVQGGQGHDNDAKEKRRKGAR